MVQLIKQFLVMVRHWWCQSITNLVSNTGVVAADVTGVGTARYGLAAASGMVVTKQYLDMVILVQCCFNEQI
jgi:hypothetical protein